MSDEYECEPVPGLPERLPAGEMLLWQGAPDWRHLARRTFLLRGLAFYFGALALWRVAIVAGDGASAGKAMLAGLLIAAGGAAAVGLLALIAWLMARSTVYSITNRRVVMRFGVALPMTVNLPFRSIEAVDLQRGGDGCGDLSLRLAGRGHLAYLALWPHARPWRYARPEPMLRALPSAATVGELLARALAGTAELREHAAPAGTAQRPAGGGLAAAGG